MATKPKFRVIHDGTEDRFPRYELVMPDGNRYLYAYGKMQKINPKPLTRMKRIDNMEPTVNEYRRRLNVERKMAEVV
jgi:hypothetical protein